MAVETDYPNPLLDYRSYSYHHVLAIANDTRVVDELLKSTKLSDFIHTDKNRRELRANPNDPSGATGSYVVLINGMQDADFVINAAKWQNIMTPGFGASATTTMAVEGTMTIIEPKGVRFFNAMNDALSKLGVEPSDATFILKTIFVGHHSKLSNIETENIMNVKPITFVPYDITVDFSEVGASYDLSFVATTNGASKLPQVANMSQLRSISIDKPSLQSAMDALQNKLQQQYETQYEEILKNNPSLENLYEKIRKVKYQIKLHPMYTKPDYKIDDIQNAATSETGEQNNKNQIITFGPNTTIESAIKMIMESSKQVKEDGKQQPDKTQRIFKIHSTIKSQVGPQAEYVVTYYIMPYDIVTAPVEEALSGSPSIEKKYRVLSFDYIFTGKNVNVLSYDMKMEMGLLFFQTIAGTNAVNKTSESTNVKPKDQGAAQGSSDTPSSQKRKLTTVYMPVTEKDSLTAQSPSPLTSSNFRALLARHAALEMIESKISIIGDPRILSDLVVTDFDIEDTFSQNINDKTSGNKNETSPAKHWTSAPVLVKVNVKMPSEDSPGYFDDFWYQGYYYLLSVENVFDDGAFTQNLEMFSLPTSNKDSNKSDQPKETR